MNRLVSIETRQCRALDAGRVQVTEKPRYITLASGRRIPSRVVDMVYTCSRELWAMGHGARLIESLRTRFVGLTRDELVELVFGHALAVDAENAGLRTTMASAMAVAQEAKRGVWWQDQAA